MRPVSGWLVPIVPRTRRRPLFVDDPFVGSGFRLASVGKALAGSFLSSRVHYLFFAASCARYVMRQRGTAQH